MNYHIDSGRNYYVIELKSVLSTSYEFDFHSRIPLSDYKKSMSIKYPFTILHQVFNPFSHSEMLSVVPKKNFHVLALS